ncbi:hypothetical protein [Paraburkholderia fungorum]|uniref:hypothetical protein n=1 Tax=Paraburkholderia fungorum TaxID=134537 RepID=UPI00402B5B71
MHAAAKFSKRLKVDQFDPYYRQLNKGCPRCLILELDEHIEELTLTGQTVQLRLDDVDKMSTSQNYVPAVRECAEDKAATRRSAVQHAGSA